MLTLVLFQTNCTTPKCGYGLPGALFGPAHDDSAPAGPAPEALSAATQHRKDSGEQFAFLNFSYEGGYFDKIVFTETSSAGFESDNHTVAYLNPPVPSGTVIGDDAPEPGSMALVTLGAAGLIWLKRRATTGC